MREAELQAAVLGLCGQRIYVFRAPDSRTAAGCTPGFPDLVLAGPAGVLLRELKGSDGVLQPEQRAWGQQLKRAGLDWGVWRPSDLRSGVIIDQLHGIGHV